ncbi:MAG: hypothetical protein JWQ23_860 [Herminiimonas sp.]|jgi:hypothetical protein|nr:hypothetical protein [Herminiimonas sp.]
MTPQENQSLQTLLGQLTQVRGISKDPQAEQMIAAAVAQQPDAAYLLVQRAMILEQALETAKAQISELQQQAQQAPAPGGNKNFLDVNAWGNTGGARAAAATGSEPERSVTGRPLSSNSSSASPMAPQQNAFPQANAARPASSGFLGGGGGSMLGTMAATAAGVAGGAFLFQGIGSLLGNRNEAGGADSHAKNEAAPAAPPQEAATQQNDTALNDQPATDQPSIDNASFDDTASEGGSFDDGSFDI